MLRISTIDTRLQRKLILEGKLVGPWLGELREVFRKANETLEGRKLVIDLTDVTVISCEAEGTLTEFIQEGAKLSCGRVLTKHLLKQLSRRCHGSGKDLRNSDSND
jgi:anti-anti-sigma regulatory factor